jgi:tRNA (cytidine/uridine-2'-O-)-methyltransferase
MYNIALFQPYIPQNTAATIRLCACLNATLEIIEPCGFQFNEKKLKSIYMDYYEKCKIIRHLSFENFFETKNKRKIILLRTKAKKIYYNFQFKRDDTILFGRKSAGVPDYVHKIFNERLKIPVPKDTRSLNVVTSVSIVLSEALRQNNYSNIL